MFIGLNLGLNSQTFTATITNQTCSGLNINGQVDVQISGNNPGETFQVVYYNNTTNQILLTQNVNSAPFTSQLTNLSGPLTIRVSVQSSLGTTIPDQIVMVADSSIPLAWRNPETSRYIATQECGFADDEFRITAETFTVAESPNFSVLEYRLVNQSTSAATPWQTSNVFNGVIAVPSLIGNSIDYKLEVRDPICNETIETNVRIDEINSGLTNGVNRNLVFSGCDSVSFNPVFTLNQQSAILQSRFPLTNIRYELSSSLGTTSYTPSTTTLANSGGSEIQFPTIEFQYAFDENYTITIFYDDACTGMQDSITTNFIQISGGGEPVFADNCGQVNFSISNLGFFGDQFTIEFTTSPAGFNPFNIQPSFFNNGSLISNTINSSAAGSNISFAGAPNGQYIYRVSSISCPGRTHLDTFNLTSFPLIHNNPIISSSSYCEADSGDVQYAFVLVGLQNGSFNGNTNIQSVIVRDVISTTNPNAKNQFESVYGVINSGLAFNNGDNITDLNGNPAGVFVAGRSCYRSSFRLFQAPMGAEIIVDIVTICNDMYEDVSIFTPDQFIFDFNASINRDCSGDFELNLDIVNTNISEDVLCNHLAFTDPTIRPQTFPRYYILKRDNTNPNLYTNPSTGAVVNLNDVYDVPANIDNGLRIEPDSADVNITSGPGTYVLVRVDGFDFNLPDYYCIPKIFYEFEYINEAVSSAIASFVCDNDSTQVYIDVQNTVPFTHPTLGNIPYLITLTEFDDGNGTQTLPNTPANQSIDGNFYNLSPGTYTYIIQDSCSTSNPRMFTTNSGEVRVTPDICEGMNSSLSLPLLVPGTTVQWLFQDDNDPNYPNGTFVNLTGLPTVPNGSPIPSGLSVSASGDRLYFSPYQASLYGGLYKAQYSLPSGTPTSCLSGETDSLVLGLSNNPGNDTTIIYKKSEIDDGTISTPLNLLNLLNPNFNYGNFVEVTSSGRAIVNGQLWNPSGLAASTYVFEYRLPLECGALSDPAILRIIITDINANDDSLTLGSCDTNQVNDIINILDNDSLLGNVLMSSDVSNGTISIALATADPSGFLTLNTSNGNISLGANAPTGTYSLDYFLFLTANPTNRSETVTVRVTTMMMDTINPTISCNDTTVYLDATGNVMWDTSYLRLTLNDNCGIDSVWMSIDSALCSNDTVRVTTYVRDNSMNIDSCISEVIVLDTLNPTISCNDTTVYLDATGNVMWDTSYLSLTLNDNCGIDSVWMSIDSALCSNDTVMVTTYVRDNSMNIDSCTSEVIVLDTLNPTISCNDTTVYLDATGNVMWDTSYLRLTLNDNCGIDSVWMSIDSALCSNDTVMVTTYVRDNSMNIDSCISEVIVLDTLNPTISCNDTTVYLDATGNVMWDTSYLSLSLNDNCGIDSVWMSIDSALCSNDTVRVTTYVRDNSMNIDSCISEVIVLDTLNPTISCNDTTVYLDATGNVMWDTSYLSLTLNDNCGIDSVWMSIDSALCSNDTVMVTTYVRDNSMNIDSCISEVIVLDTLNPTISCNDTTVYLDATGNVMWDTSYLSLTLNDNCGIDSVWMSIDSALCSNDTVRVTTYVRDNSMNIDSCISEVIVLDTIAPLVMCKDTTIYLDINGMASIDSSYIENGFSDNCGVDTLEVSKMQFDCNDLGPNMVALTVYDLIGNNNTCLSTITVLDTIKPVVYCKDTTLYVNTLGQVSLMASDLDSMTSDNCNFTLNLSQSNFDCSDLGVQNVWLIATDAFGNTDSCLSRVTIADSSLNNHIYCNDTTVYLDNNGTSSITPNHIFNYPTGICITIDSVWMSDSTFTCPEVGINSIFVYYRNNYGVIDSCNANVTVMDTIKPNVNCVSNLNIYLQNGTASITVNDIDNNSVDNCGIQNRALNKMNFNCTDIGTQNIILTVTDINGNIDSCITSVNVLDTNSPTVICQDIIVQLDNNGRAQISVNDIDNGSNDDCGNITLSISDSIFNCDDIGTQTITLYAIDGSNNIDSCQANVTIEDNIAPTIICPSDRTDTIISSLCNYIIEDYRAAIIQLSDNCTDTDSLIVTQSPTPGQVIDASNSPFTQTITIRVEDENGNADECMFDIEIVCLPFLKPNEFISPNGDGKNDLFVIEGIERFPDNKLMIYNRWGALIYEQDKYQNTWDGKPNSGTVIFDAKDGFVPDGTYFYILEVNSSNEKNHYKGYLQVQR